MSLCNHLRKVKNRKAKGDYNLIWSVGIGCCKPQRNKPLYLANFLILRARYAAKDTRFVGVLVLASEFVQSKAEQQRGFGPR